MEVPVYEEMVLTNLKSGDPFIARLLRAERRLACPYCLNCVVRYQHPLTFYIGPEGPLEASRGASGLQTDDYLAVCTSCGFWFGRGTRDWRGGPWMNRVVWGKLREYEIDAIDVPTRELIRYLHRNENRLLSVDPFKAEALVEQMMADTYGCDVERIGGRQDKGVDLYLLKDGDRDSIVQVKWREDRGRAEGVRVVRELCGTLVARGVPKGVIVTTRNYMSKDALREIDNIRGSPLAPGLFRIDPLVHGNLLEMLSLSARKLGEAPLLPEKIVEDHIDDDVGDPRGGCIFG